MQDVGLGVVATNGHPSPVQSHQLHNKWYSEPLQPSLFQVCALKETRHWSKSEFQEMEILTLDPFGTCLVLDHRIQSSSLDEFIYHEALVQPAMVSHPCPKTVFIGGGGEGATLREVLRHDSVEKVVMVDIDKHVIDQCKLHLKSHHKDSFSDSRLEMHYDDAKKVLKDYPEGFDVIILDLADPVEEGPCYLLYTVEFYNMLKSKLNPGGIFVTQSGPASLLTMDDVFCPIYKTLKKVWGDNVYPSVVHVPSFGDCYAYNVISETNIATLDVEEIDKRIEERVKGGSSVFRFYDGEAHRGLFSIPKYLRTSLAKEKRIITDSMPLYAYTGRS